MILAAHQPQFLPWPGYFDKIARADVFVLLDDVQFKKNEWQNRNRIKTADGAHWLTVPVVHHLGQSINDTKIDDTSHWRTKNARTLREAYAGAPSWADHEAFLDEIHSMPWGGLGELNVFGVRELCRSLGVRTPLHLSSEIQVPGASTERLVNLCRGLGADVYLAGAGGKDYMEMDLFERAGIRVEFQEFTGPVYPQLHGAFVPNLTVLDLLLNCGKGSADILGLNSTPGGHGGEAGGRGSHPFGPSGGKRAPEI